MSDKVKNKYWKVRKNNIKEYFDEKLNIYISEKWLEYVEDDCIYVGTYMSMGSWSYGYMYFNKRSQKFFERENYTYEGEFFPIKQHRKNKLNKLYESNL